jgi:hypothetical protein
MDDPLALTELGDAVLNAKALKYMRIFPSAEKCRGVARGIFLATCSAGFFTCTGFCLVSHRSPGGAMMPAAVTGGRPILSWP